MVDYNRQQTLNLIDRSPVLVQVYLGYCKEMCDPKKKFDQDGVDRAIRRVFDERIADPVSGKLYEKDWERATPIIRPYEYEEIPAHDWQTTLVSRLEGTYGWQPLMHAFKRYAMIKAAEMQNGGFHDQKAKWEKMADSFKKMSSLTIMT